MIFLDFPLTFRYTYVSGCPARQFAQEKCKAASGGFFRLGRRFVDLESRGDVEDVIELRPMTKKAISAGAVHSVPVDLRKVLLS
ncbi:MAG: hypothetical protein WBD87_07820, partial [Candidatus Acidiferrales bacterium]